MPFDGLIWGEEGAANGLTGTTSKGPSGYVVTGDAITTKKGMGRPILFGLGNTGDTKPQGGAVIPQYSNRNTYIYCPGHIHFSDHGFADLRTGGGIPLQPGETLTGYTSSTNVNEGRILLGQLCYDNMPMPMQMRKYSKLMIEKITVTSAAAVTFNSGATALSSALTSSNFIDTSKNYELVATVPNIGAATFGGALTIANLSGIWNGFYPAVPIGGLSAVDFGVSNAYYFPEPLPLSGEEFDTVTAGMTASSAGAITTGLMIGEI